MMNQYPQYTEYNDFVAAQMAAQAEKQERKRQQKSMRRDASRISLAVVAALPLSSILSALAGIFLALCGVNLAATVGGINGMPAHLYYLLSSMMTFLTIALPFMLFILAGGRRLEDSILVEKTGVLNGLLLAFAGLLICLLMNIPANLLSGLFEDAGLNGASNTAGMSADSLIELLCLCFSVVLVAPVAEEFAFRGVTVAVMRRWGDWPAVFFSAVIFALAHYSFQSLPVVFTGGFIMALLYVLTRNIWVNILVHFLNNLIAVLPIIVGYFAGEEAANLVNEYSMPVVMVLGVIAIIILVARHFTEKHRLSFHFEKGEAVRKKVLWLFCNPGFIVYFIVFIVMALRSLYAV